MNLALPHLSDQQLAVFLQTTAKYARKLRSRKLATVDLLSKATRRSMAPLDQMSSFAGIEAASGPALLETHDISTIDVLDLYDVDRIIHEYWVDGLTTRALAQRFSLGESVVAGVIQRILEWSADLGIRVSDDASAAGDSWFTSRVKSLRGIKVPNHLRTLPTIQSMAAIEFDASSVGGAIATLKTFNQSQCEWRIRNDIDLRALLGWLDLVGIVRNDITIFSPHEAGGIDPSSKYVSVLKGANVVKTSPRPGRRRGNDAVVVKVKPDDHELACSTLVYATFLWLISKTSTCPVQTGALTRQEAA